MTSVRRERAADRPAIHALLTAAFGSAAEADLVDTLRREGDLALSLVAERQGVIVGHVAFSPMRVTAREGATITAMGLAPLAVAADSQRQGLGARLVHAGLDELRTQGLAMVFLLGDATYYGRFGFLAETAAPFASPYAGPHFLALKLDPSLALPQKGQADYAPAFAALG